MTLRIIQISDTHISRDYPLRTADLERAIQAINAADPQPDLVIHTGDVADYGLAEQYAIARGVLDRLRTPYVVLAGNRDSRRELISAFADKLQVKTAQSESPRFGATSFQCSNVAFDAPFVQYSIEQFDTRVLVIDTLKVGNNKGELCDARFAHLERMLATDTSRPIVVFMHHPPFQADEIPDPFQFDRWSDVEKFGALIARHDKVRGVFCGHLHRTIAAVCGQVPASSISSMAGDLRKGPVSAAERAMPMFRMLSFG